MINTADLGITTQKLICDKFSLELHPNAVNQFAANFNPTYTDALLPIIDKRSLINFACLAIIYKIYGISHASIDASFNSSFEPLL